MTAPTSQPKPDGLEQKFRLLALLPYDERARRKHSLVFGFVLDWYHSKYGDALASVRHVVETIKERDPAGKGLGQASVHSALTDLTAWGYLQKNVGSGKRASRYIPNWSMLNSSVHPVENTTSVHPALNDDVHPALNANHDSVHHVANEDPSTGPGDKTRGHVVGNEFEAAPVAPLADGLEAVAAVPASGGFDQFWSIWPRKHGKAAARVAFGKIDAAVHPSLLDAARAWAEHYAKNDTDKKWIPEPANWLTKERWDEDLPIIHDDAKGAAIAKAKANAPANSSKNSPARSKEKIDRFPTGLYAVTSGKKETFGISETNLIFQFTPEGFIGETITRELPFENPSYEVQNRGHAEFSKLCFATGILEPEAAEDFVGYMVMLRARPDGGIDYAIPVPTNDNAEVNVQAAC